jgi:hypothetical protein
MKSQRNAYQVQQEKEEEKVEHSGNISSFILAQGVREAEEEDRDSEGDNHIQHHRVQDLYNHRVQNDPFLELACNVADKTLDKIALKLIKDSGEDALALHRGDAERLIVNEIEKVLKSGEHGRKLLSKGQVRDFVLKNVQEWLGTKGADGGARQDPSKMWSARFVGVIPENGEKSKEITNNHVECEIRRGHSGERGKE